MLERRILQPRTVTLLTDSNNTLSIIVKDLTTYIDLINNPETDDRTIIRAYGERNTAVCNFTFQVLILSLTSSNKSSDRLY